MTKLADEDGPPLGEIGDPLAALAERPLSRLAAPVYLPAAVYAVGNGAVTPMIAITAHDLGASLTLAGLIAGLPLIGRLLGDAPSGSLVGRVGERAAMLWASAFTLLATVAVLAVQTLVVLSVAGLVMGVASSTFMLARHALITDNVPARFRGRALAMLAGMVRTGMAVGPFLTAALIGWTGALAAYWIQMVTTVAVMAFLMRVPDVAGGASRHAMHESHNTVQMLARNADVFLKLGIGIGTLMMLRMARPIIVPLWGLAIDLDPTTIAIAMGVSGALEVALFYVGGYLTDRFGRTWVAVPVTAGMAVGTAGLALAHGVVAFFVVTAVIALANSLGGGIMMTMGSDLAVGRGKTSQFLGVWRLFSDGATALAPFIISAATALAGPALAAGALGVVGGVGAGMLWRWMPAYFGAELDAELSNTL
ncbi:MAG: MFS transporter [Nocardioides sp.]|uniref:MFS transporter n=1 Tax=Nocardioides sp. TaxID=35761 RepID=UPI0039E28394